MKMALGTIGKRNRSINRRDVAQYNKVSGWIYKKS